MRLFEYERLSTLPHCGPVYHVFPHSSWFAARLLVHSRSFWIRASARAIPLGSGCEKPCDADSHPPRHLAQPSFEPKLDLLEFPTSPQSDAPWKDLWQSPAAANAHHAYPL